MKQALLTWRPHTTAILIGGVVLVILATAASFIISTSRPTVEVKIGSSGVYKLWIADNEPARIIGLSGVESLPPNGGLLMDFQEDNEAGIWMKDMKLPLDIVWLDADKKVIYIVTNASPELSTTKTFTPPTPARYVIELSSGSVKNGAIKIGSAAEFVLRGE